MTTKTVTEPEPMSATTLDNEFKHLALLAVQGDKSAEKKLIEVEARVEDLQRQERRRLAAEAEERRLEAEAQRQATLAAHAENERLRLVALEVKDRTYSLVEQYVDELSEAVRTALDAGGEFRAAQLRLGYAPGRLPTDELFGYIALKLGADGAGLGDFPFINPVLRQPLVQE
jgi:hypothetical protein